MNHFTVEKEFIQAITETGITPPEQVTINGKIDRFSTNGKVGNKDGWYWVNASENVSYGVFGCWRSGDKGKWASVDESTLDSSQLRKIQNDTF